MRRRVEHYGRQVGEPPLLPDTLHYSPLNHTHLPQLFYSLPAGRQGLLRTTRRRHCLVNGIRLLRYPACCQGNRSGVLDVAAAQPVPMYADNN